MGRPTGKGTQAERVLRLFIAITSARPVWLKTLAAELGVTPRTVYRDLAVVSRALAPDSTIEHAADGQVRLVAAARAA